MKKANSPRISTDSLPKGILKSDLKYPESADYIPYSERGEYDPTALTFYLVKSMRRDDMWVMTTLDINAKRGRAYGIGVEDKKMYTVGAGPHVAKTVTVYLKKSNMARLQKFVDLYLQGAITANQIRDRRSTRIARGRAYRASLMPSWY